MSLYEQTRDLHHACEQHEIGQRMADSTISAQEWADWLDAFRVLHGVVDSHLPDHMRREPLLQADLALLPRARPSAAAYAFASALAAAPDVTGAAYVLHGAHRSGGRVLAARMAAAGLPTAHIAYAFPVEVQTWVASQRGRLDMAEQARAAFGCLLDVMTEIKGR